MYGNPQAYAARALLSAIDVPAVHQTLQSAELQSFQMHHLLL